LTLLQICSAYGCSLSSIVQIDFSIATLRALFDSLDQKGHQFERCLARAPGLLSLRSILLNGEHLELGITDTFIALVR
jgi:hypothetical protein